MIVFRAGAQEKSSKDFSRKTLTVPKLSQSPNSLSQNIAKHTRLVPKTEELSAANQNRARKTHIFRQPIRIEHGKTLQLCQPIRIEYYVTRVVSESESSITSPESSRLGLKTFLGSRFDSALYSLS